MNNKKMYKTGYVNIMHQTFGKIGIFFGFAYIVLLLISDAPMYGIVFGFFLCEAVSISLILRYPKTISFINNKIDISLVYNIIKQYDYSEIYKVSYIKTFLNERLIIHTQYINYIVEKYKMDDFYDLYEELKNQLGSEKLYKGKYRIYG